MHGCVQASERTVREHVPFITMYQRRPAVPAEDRKVRRERMNTPKRTGKQQQKCFDIFVKVLVPDVDWVFATTPY